MLSQQAKHGLAHLDDAVGHSHLLAQGRQPHDQLEGVDVVRDHDHLSLAGLNEVGDVVDAKLDNNGLLLVSLLPSGTGLSLGLEALLLLLLVLRPGDCGSAD